MSCFICNLCRFFRCFSRAFSNLGQCFFFAVVKTAEVASQSRFLLVLLSLLSTTSYKSFLYNAVTAQQPTTTISTITSRRRWCLHKQSHRPQCHSHSGCCALVRDLYLARSPELRHRDTGCWHYKYQTTNTEYKSHCPVRCFSPHSNSEDSSHSAILHGSSDPGRCPYTESDGGSGKTWRVNLERYR